MRKLSHYGLLAAFSFVFIALSGCNAGGSSTTSAVGVGGPVLVSWTANRETEMSQSGSGYRVYHSQTSGVALSSATMIDVPRSGGVTPTSVTIPFLPPGNNYIRVVAYTAANPTGSAPSAQFVVNVP